MLMRSKSVIAYKYAGPAGFAEKKMRSGVSFSKEIGSLLGRVFGVYETL